MKKLVMTLAALCVAGVASAVTVNWNYWGNYQSTDETGGGRFDLEEKGYSLGTSVGSKVTFAAIINGVSIGFDRTIFGFEKDNEGTDRSSIRILTKLANKDGNIGYQLGGGTLTWLGLNNTTGFQYGETQNAFAATLERTAEGEITLTMYLNGKNLGSWKMENSSVIGSMTYGQALNGGEKFKGNWQIFATKEDIVATDVTVENLTAVLPEPTALALLALGVAGLALRRKVA